MSTSPCSTSSESEPSTSTSSNLDVTFRKCRLCPRIAFTTNYNLLTCDACKMFFRRIVVLNKTYTCKNTNQCTANSKTGIIHCKACRYQKCVDAGMMYRPNFMMEVENTEFSDLNSFVGQLVWLDLRRSKNMKTKFSNEDFTLKEILELRLMKMSTKKPEMSTHDWSFWSIYTSLEFLMGFDFLEHLPTSDKIILIKSFCVKASLFASAMRAKREGRDRLMTVDGRDVFPDSMMELPMFNQGFLHRIRSVLVARLNALMVTNEEFAMVNIILCCNPALDGLSEKAIEHLTMYQKKYSTFLFQYCQYTHQQNAPSRFTDLLSLCHVINKNFEDVQYMTMIFKFYVKSVDYRKIVNELV